MAKFKASVQYNDLLGSVAADRADKNDASKWLQDNGKIKKGEHVIGISMFAGENHGVHQDPVSVTFLVSDLKGYENIPEMLESTKEPIPIKQIEEDMNITDFLALFKRFEVTLSIKGIIEGKTFKAE
jgi:hypothetical protein